LNTDNVTRDDWILGGVTLALIITLLFLPWFSISVGPFTVTATATASPDGWCGVLALLAAIALLVDLSLERLSPQTHVPSLNDSRTQTRFVLACVTALFVALKFLLHVHFGWFGWGFWVAVILTVALLYVAYQAHNATPVGTARNT
jgi:hypothetical protein